VPRSEDRLTGNRWNVTFADYLDWREARVFEHVAVYSTATLNTMSDGGPERISSAFITEEFFPTLGLPAALGRLPTAEMFRPGAGRYAVISNGLWHRAFGGEPSAVGKTLAITGVPAEILGVLPPEFDFPSGVDLWIPYKETPADSPYLAERDNYMFAGVARLAPDRTLEATQVLLGTMAARVEQDNPRERASISITGSCF
jgi:putative ABC transport system permease protein